MVSRWYKGPRTTDHPEGATCSRYTYERKGCRCDGCCAAQAVKGRADYEAKRPPAGVEVVEITYARTGSIKATMLALSMPYHQVWLALSRMRQAIEQERAS